MSVFRKHMDFVVMRSAVRGRVWNPTLRIAENTGVGNGSKPFRDMRLSTVFETRRKKDCQYLI